MDFSLFTEGLDRRRVDIFNHRSAFKAVGEIIVRILLNSRRVAVRARFGFDFLHEQVAELSRLAALGEKSVRLRLAGLNDECSGEFKIGEK